MTRNLPEISLVGVRVRLRLLCRECTCITPQQSYLTRVCRWFKPPVNPQSIAQRPSLSALELGQAQGLIQLKHARILAVKSRTLEASRGMLVGHPVTSQLPTLSSCIFNQHLWVKEVLNGGNKP